MDASKVKPKRILAPFFHFVKEQRKLTRDVTGKDLGKRWKAMTLEEKQKYFALARQDSERFVMKKLVGKHGEEEAKVRFLVIKDTEYKLLNTIITIESIHPDYFK